MGGRGGCLGSAIGKDAGYWSCVHSRGHSFASIFLNCNKNIYLDISVNFENGLCGIKN